MKWTIVEGFLVAILLVGIFLAIRRIERKNQHPPKGTQRVGLKLLPYDQADAYIKSGWAIAPEEDDNKRPGFVFLEKLEPVRTLEEATEHIAKRLGVNPEKQ